MNPLPNLRTRRRLLLCAAAVLLALCAALAYALYYCSPTLLLVDSGDSRAAAIVVLGGDPYSRPIRAAELFNHNAAPLVIASGNGDCEEMVRALKANGVPAQCILREDKSTTTRENARFTAALLAQRGLTNAIIVTSWYHSRRALASFRKAAPNITFYSRPTYYAIDRRDWRRTGTARQLRREWLKLPLYWLRDQVL